MLKISHRVSPSLRRADMPPTVLTPGAPLVLGPEHPERGLWRDRFVTVDNPRYGSQDGNPFQIRLVRERVPTSTRDELVVALKEDVAALNLHQFVRDIAVRDSFAAFRQDPNPANAKSLALALLKLYAPDNGWFPAFAAVTVDFTILAPVLKNAVAFLWAPRMFWGPRMSVSDIPEVLPEHLALRVLGFAACLSLTLTGVEGLPLIVQAPLRTAVDEWIGAGIVERGSRAHTLIMKGLIGLGIRYGREMPEKIFRDYSRGDLRSWANDFALNCFIVPVVSGLMEWEWRDTVPMAALLSAIAATGSMRITKVWGHRPGLAAFVRSGYFSALNALGALSAAGVVPKTDAYFMECVVAFALFAGLHLFQAPPPPEKPSQIQP